MSTDFRKIGNKLFFCKFNEFYSLTCAFDLWTGLVRAAVAVRDPVAELGDLEQLEDVDGGVHLAPEEAVLEVEEENLGGRPRAGARGGRR